MASKPTAVKQLEFLCSEWLSNKRVFDAAKVRDDLLKDEIRRLAAKISPERLETVGKTSTVAGVRITRTDPSVPKVVPAELLSRIGPAVFLRVATIKDIDLNMEEWRAALRAEEVCERDLLESLGPTPQQKAWSVGVA